MQPLFHFQLVYWSYRISDLSAPDDCITHYYPNDTYIVTGLSVDKRGWATNFNSGNVTNVSYSFVYNGTSFTDQVGISNTQLGGDSGGPVFHSIERAGAIDYRILLGIATFKDGNNNGYCSKVENIIDILGVGVKYKDDA